MDRLRADCMKNSTKIIFFYSQILHPTSQKPTPQLLWRWLRMRPQLQPPTMAIVTTPLMAITRGPLLQTHVQTILWMRGCSRSGNCKLQKQRIQNLQVDHQHTHMMLLNYHSSIETFFKRFSVFDFIIKIKACHKIWIRKTKGCKRVLHDDF